MAAGNEILAYQGNSALAGGYGGDGNPMLGSPKDHIGELNDILKDVYSRNAALSMVKYNQKIKDRDDTMKAISQADMSIPLNAGSGKGGYDDNDREKVERQWGRIKDVLLKNNGNLRKNANSWAEYQQEFNKFNDMKVSAQSRYVEAAKQRQEIANETNPEKRARRAKFLQDQLGQGIYKQIDPYPEEVTYTPKEVLGYPVATGAKVSASSSANTPKDFTGSEDLEFIPLPNTQVKYVKDDKGLMHKTGSMAPNLPKWIDMYRPQNFMAGGDMKRADQYQQFMDDVLNHDKLKPEMVAAINTKLDGINKQWGSKPGDENYIDPLAVTNNNGQIIPKGTPADFALKMSLFNFYQTKEMDELSKEAQDLSKINAEEKKLLAMADKEQSVAALNKVKQKTEKAHQNLYYEQAKKARIEGDIKQEGFLLKKAENTEPATTTLHEFKKINLDKGWEAPQAIISKTIGSGSIMGNPESAMLSSILQPYEKDYQVKQVPLDGNIRKITAMPTTTKNGTLSGMSYTPKEVYAIRKKNGGVNDVQLVAVYKDGKSQTFDMKQSVENLVKVRRNFSGDDKMLSSISSSIEVLDDLLGDEVQAQEQDVQEEVNALDNPDETRELEGNVYYRKGKEWYDSNGQLVQ